MRSIQKTIDRYFWTSISHSHVWHVYLCL
jgi:hypothetical protein